MFRYFVLAFVLLLASIFGTSLPINQTYLVDLNSTNLGDLETKIQVKNETFTLAELTEKLKGLDSITVPGNVTGAAALVSSIAQVLNHEESSEEKSTEDIKESQKLRDKLVSALVDNANVTKNTSLADVAQISSTLDAVTAVSKENSEETTKNVAAFIENAADAILQQASEKVASSEKIKEASEAVFGAAVNLILSVDSSQEKIQSSSETPETKESAQNIARKALKTIDKLTTALLTTKIRGEDETTIKTSSLEIGVSREKESAIGNIPITLTGSEVTFPDNITAFDNLNASVDRVFQSIKSAVNQYSGDKGADLVNNTLVSLLSLGYDNITKENSEEKNAEEVSQELREKIVLAVVDNADITNDTSLADVAQISSILGAVTAVPKENSEEPTSSPETPTDERVSLEYSTGSS